MNNRNENAPIEEDIKADRSPTSACDMLKKLLKSKPKSHVGLFFEVDYTIDISNIKRAKIACEYGLVVKPTVALFQPMHRKYIPPEEYEQQLQHAEKKSEGSSYRRVWK